MKELGHQKSTYMIFEINNFDKTKTVCQAKE